MQGSGIDPDPLAPAGIAARAARLRPAQAALCGLAEPVTSEHAGRPELRVGRADVAKARRDCGRWCTAARPASSPGPVRHRRARPDCEDPARVPQLAAGLDPAPGKTAAVRVRGLQCGAGSPAEMWGTSSRAPATVSTRFCLKVTGQVENDIILGTSAALQVGAPGDLEQLAIGIGEVPGIAALCPGTASGRGLCCDRAVPPRCGSLAPFAVPGSYSARSTVRPTDFISPQATRW
jgi:hypothetical protein